METKQFKKIYEDVLLSKGLSKRGSYFYKENQDLILIIGLQKSSYSNAYYINVGYVIKQLNPALTNPRDVDGDIRTRFEFIEDDRLIDLLELDKIMESEQESIKGMLVKNVEELIESVNSTDDLKQLVIKIPALLYQTKVHAKKILGF